ncbi:hypothetical protein RIF29_03868 [Crotalaria pallida]|uniref:CCHC-type domain-containing protein n=1 Tax=Crotalaria pallida TaxID=3830 RepID=A0AAN9J0E5_CROPI
MHVESSDSREHNELGSKPASTNRSSNEEKICLLEKGPPLFSGEGYAYWKVRVKIFIQAIDNEIWKAIEKGPHISSTIVEGAAQLTPEDKWTDDDKKKIQLDYKAKNIITSALSYDEFFRISQCSSAKEMWDTLQVTHEGTSEVRRARLNVLMREYELCQMLPNESIIDLQKRFTHIINHLLALGKAFLPGELTNKVLRCLDRNWQPKVTAIIESKSLDTMDLATLFGKLQEHEMELGRLTSNEESDRKKKGIALKASSRSVDTLNDSSLDDDTDSDLDDESLAFVVKKFRKFFKKKGNTRRFNSKESKETPQRSKTPRDKIICHTCGKAGHIKYHCPQKPKKSDSDKKRSNNHKAKKAYIVWDEPEDDTNSSTSEDEESANLCLMANDDIEASTSDTSLELSSSKEVHSKTNSDMDSDSESCSSPSYDALYNAYVDMHAELKKLAKINIEAKKAIL